MDGSPERVSSYLGKRANLVQAVFAPLLSSPALVCIRWPLDETWDYSHGWVVGETGVVCSWDDVREGSLDMPTCAKGICGGHRATDVLPFEVKVCVYRSCM